MRKTPRDECPYCHARRGEHGMAVVWRLVRLRDGGSLVWQQGAVPCPHDWRLPAWAARKGYLLNHQRLKEEPCDARPASA